MTEEHYIFDELLEEAEHGMLETTVKGIGCFRVREYSSDGAMGVFWKPDLELEENYEVLVRSKSKDVFTLLRMAEDEIRRRVDRHNHMARMNFYLEQLNE